MLRRERLYRSGATLFLAVLASPANAEDCAGSAGTSTCFDADTLWMPAAPSPFVGIPGSSAIGAHRTAFGLGVVYLSRPVVLEAASPDPNGRTVRVVDDVLDASLTGAVSPARHLELDLVIPMALYRTGTGLTGANSQTGPALTGAALRDVRVGAGHDLVLSPSPDSRFRFSAMARLELALPTGNRDAFAGDRGPVMAPSITLGGRLGSIFLGAQEGARFRSSVDFGGTRIGTEIVSSLGAGVDALPEGKLSLSLEAWILPNFLTTARHLPDGTAVSSGALVPAEWLASLSTRFASTTLGIGGGTALPLSHETRTDTHGAESTEHFAGVTTPQFRFVVTLRYEASPW